MFDVTEIFSTFSFVFIVANICFIRGDEVSDFANLIRGEVAASLTYQLPTDNSHLYSETSAPIQDGGVFSYIIVGAGSAGAVLAKRLSDNPLRTVLLLEAGDDQSTLTDIPQFFRNLQNSKMNWGYYTTSQTHACQGMIDKKCTYPRGLVMGGTSSTNAFMYVRTSPYDHDLWTNSGVTGWTWKDVLAYYLILESYSLQDSLISPGYHGTIGPLNIEKSTPPIPFVIDYFLKANNEVYSTTNDYNGKVKMGAGATHYTKKNGKRWSSTRAYLSNINKSLTIKKKAYAYKVVLENKRAVGIEFMQGGRKFLAKAKNEIIISAGAINSPQLLMLSGIGPREELSKHTIPVIADLPVGQNMEDHIGFIGLQFTSDVLLSNSSIPLEDHVRDYLQQGKGRLTESYLSSVVFYATDGRPNPDIEFIMLPLGRPVTATKNIFNLNAESMQTFTPPAATFDKTFSLIIMLLHQVSRGSVTLKSNSPADFPNINPNSLSDANQEDIRRIYEATKYFENKLLKAPTMIKINAKLLDQVLPACAGLPYKSKEYWYCQIKHMSHQIYHATGTCRMGVSAKDSVVDSRLRVHGVAALRVVDASVIPYSPSCHPHAPVMMIAEKAADMIQRDNL